MNIRFTPEGGGPVYLCWLPEKIKTGGQGKFMTYGIISLGDVKIPRGSALETISWTSIFPGESRLNEPYVREEFWMPPTEYIFLFSMWRDEGIKVNVMIDEAGINMDCYVEKFDGKFTGGHGDYEYDVQFVEAQEIEITSEPSSFDSGGGSKKKKKKKKNKKKRKKSKSKKAKTSGTKTTTTFTVKSGGTSPWRIAHSQLGNGARYEEIYNLNKEKIDSTGSNREPAAGTVITLPTG